MYSEKKSDWFRVYLKSADPVVFLEGGDKGC